MLYDYRFVIYIIMFLSIYFVLIAIKKAFTYGLEQRIKAQRDIAELQMKSIKNSIDPHFTLNIINSIGSMFANQDKEKADYIFGKYSKFLRNTILNSDKIISTLEDELEYVENYMALEKNRLKHGLTYQIEVDDNSNTQIKVPKMIIHSFVENSIKHGIRHLDKTGEIKITVKRNNQSIQIFISDNGIGRKMAKQFSKYSTGQGLTILKEIISLYYKLEKVKITFSIKDLESNVGEPMGTKVEINIPIS